MASSPVEDPFFYGWRYRKKSVKGKRVWVQVPLTRDNVLHPQEGDHIHHGELHTTDMHYLADAFAIQLAHDKSAKVFHDLGVFWTGTRFSIIIARM